MRSLEQRLDSVLFGDVIIEDIAEKTKEVSQIFDGLWASKDTDVTSKELYGEYEDALHWLGQLIEYGKDDEKANKARLIWARFLTGLDHINLADIPDHEIDKAKTGIFKLVEMIEHGGQEV